ncbi:hypothetical protein WEH80_08995 [Actinomycetes bacterium KLBMP 9759]
MTVLNTMADRLLQLLAPKADGHAAACTPPEEQCACLPNHSVLACRICQWCPTGERCGTYKWTDIKCR